MDKEQELFLKLLKYDRVHLDEFKSRLFSRLQGSFAPVSLITVTSDSSTIVYNCNYEKYYILKKVDGDPLEPVLREMIDIFGEEMDDIIRYFDIGERYDE